LSPDLEGFAKALLIQTQNRCLAMKREVDEDLADIITARRIEVEKIVHDLRRGGEKRLEEGLKSNRRHAELRKKVCMSELQEGFFEHLEALVRARAEAFRRSSLYGRAMRSLALEALEHFPFPAVALVEEGDAVHLDPRGGSPRSGNPLENIQEVREELRDAWGGLVLAEAGKERGRFLDNTFRTRWRRLHAAFAEKLWGEIHV
jgi:vacuolar-type H+-ATPase subunit E/Vma4